MIKYLVTAGLALGIASSATAQGKKAAPESVHCAVMTSNAVNIKSATAKNMFADYKGRRYFFCCGGCPAAFKKDPAKYAKSESIPTPKASKGKKA